MYCERCGFILPDDAKFCEKCGSAVVKPKKKEGNRIDKKEKVVDHNSLELKKKNNKAAIIGVIVGIIALILIGVILVVKLLRILEKEKTQDDKTTESVSKEDMNIPEVSESDFFDTYEFELETENNEIVEEHIALEESQIETMEGSNSSETGNSVAGDSTAIVTIAPTQEKVKESTYEFIKGNYTWLEAHKECVKRGGHLVHFDTAGEVEKVISMFTQMGHDNTSMFWIGGARNSSDDSYSYHWVDSDGTYGDEIPLEDEHWMKGEPSYIDPGLDNLVEDKMMLFFYKDENRWVWNDEYNSPQDNMPKYAERIGFICEIEK